MDQTERMQIASVHQILTNLLDPSRDVGKFQQWRQRTSAITAAKAIRANCLEREKELSFLPSANPGWRILIELYIAEGDEKPLSVSDIWHISGIPNATTLRWLNLLAEHGLLVRKPDTNDRRRQWLGLTEYGFATVERIMYHLFSQIIDAGENRR
jgi:DNA-binding MarR family transcriptional regulator